MEIPHYSKRSLFWLSLSVAIAVAALLSFCLTYRIGSLQEWDIYQAMDAECHPIWKKLYFGHIRAGDDVSTITSIAPPSILEGDMTSGSLLYYKNYQHGDLHFTSVLIEVRNGKVACAYAGSCTWSRQFFDQIGLEANYSPTGFRKLWNRGAISVW